jgi:hypothetical protein
VTKNIAYFLPRNTDETELRQAAGPGETFEVEENYINKSLKAITVYYGDLVCNAEEAQYEPTMPELTQWAGTADDPGVAEGLVERDEEQPADALPVGDMSGQQEEAA